MFTKSGVLTSKKPTHHQPKQHIYNKNRHPFGWRFAFFTGIHPRGMYLFCKTGVRILYRVRDVFAHFVIRATENNIPVPSVLSGGKSDRKIGNIAAHIRVKYNRQIRVIPQASEVHFSSAVIFHQGISKPKTSTAARSHNSARKPCIASVGWTPSHSQ